MLPQRVRVVVDVQDLLAAELDHHIARLEPGRLGWTTGPDT